MSQKGIFKGDWKNTSRYLFLEKKLNVPREKA